MRYTTEDLNKLAKSSENGYMFSKNSTVVSVTRSIAIDDLLSDAFGKQKDVYWSAGSKMEVATFKKGSTTETEPYTLGPWADGGMSYEDVTDLNANGKFFPAATATTRSVESATAVPFVMAMAYGEQTMGEGNAADALATATTKSTVQTNGRIFFGQTVEDFTENGIGAGNRFPSGVTAITIHYTTPEFVVKWTLDGVEKGSKKYTTEDLNALAQKGKKYGYIQYKGESFSAVKGATTGIPLEDLFTNALGNDLAAYWNEGSFISLSCVDGPYNMGPWGGDGMAYATFTDLNTNGKFYPATTASAVSLKGAEESPIFLALTYGESSMKGDTSAGQARDDAVAKAVVDVPRILVGVTEEGMKDPGTYAAGKRWPSGVTEITIKASSKAEVKFDTNGGSEIKSQTGYVGAKISDPGTPTREGYKFDGWFADKELKTAVDFETWTIPAGGATLYAKWTAEPAPKPEPTPEPVVDKVSMFRLYNPNSGEHFYTSDQAEHDNLVSLGWNDEGTGWIAPSTSNTPVYRVYNANGGEHHYTMDESEKDHLVSVGWSYEGIGWYSDDAQGQVLFREYNPNALSNNHNYTTDKNEHDNLVSLGWQDEGKAWYGLAAS